MWAEIIILLELCVCVRSINKHNNLSTQDNYTYLSIYPLVSVVILK